MSQLSDLHIVEAADGAAAERFTLLVPDFKTVGGTPSEYVMEIWSRHTSAGGVATTSAPGINGKILEYTLATLLVREGITPFWLGASVAFVANVEFDILLYPENIGPICLSAKTSLRERYKQADLEAFALKNVHRRSKSHLITMDAREASTLAAKIRDGKTLGLDSVLHPSSPEFNALIGSLRALTFTKPLPLPVIDGGRCVE